MTGGQGYLDVNIGLADWIVGTSVAEDVITYLVLTPLAVVEGVEELWNLEIERQVMSEIERLIGTGQVTMQGYPNQPYQQTHINSLTNITILITTRINNPIRDTHIRGTVLHAHPLYLLMLGSVLPAVTSYIKTSKTLFFFFPFFSSISVDF